MSFEKGRSGNPSGRPKGTKNRRTELLQAVRSEFGSEEEFWIHVAHKAKTDTACLRLIAERLQSPLRAVAPLIEADLAVDSLESTLESILKGVGEGKIPSDQARDLIAAAKDVAHVGKLVEFEQKLEELEANRARLKTA